jgi:hypothetical protein
MIFFGPTATPPIKELIDPGYTGVEALSISTLIVGLGVLHNVTE